MPYRQSKEELETALADHEYLRSVGSFAMQHTLVSIYSSSTAVRPPDSVLRGRWFVDADDFVGEQALLNYRTDNANLGFQLGVGRFYEPDAVLSSCHADLQEDLSDAVELPRPKKLRTSVSAATSARRSSRSFSGRSVTLEELATMLHHAQGVSGELPYGDPADPHGTIKLRNAPSGGGIYPISLLVQAFNVDGLAAGTYEYFPHAHALGPVPTVGDDPAATFSSPDFDVNRAAFVVTFVYNLYDNSRKYGDGGMVFGLIEVGAILQSLHLARTALALAGCDQGGYDKQGIEATYQLDGHSRHVVHVTVVGQEE